MDFPEVDADARFVALADRVLHMLLELEPEWASSLGDHRFEHRLSDSSETGRARQSQAIAAALTELDAIDDTALSTDNGADLEILRDSLLSAQFQLDRLREFAWNPLVANPGTAIYQLTSREHAPLDVRLGSLGARLDQIPQALQDSRDSLGEMPRVHVETAIGQFGGTIHLLTDEVPALAKTVAGLDPAFEIARLSAVQALEEHRRWLEEKLESAEGNPRLGAELYAAKLWMTMGSTVSPDELLARAELDLDRVEDELFATAIDLSGEAGDTGDLVGRTLLALALAAPVTDEIVLPLCADAMQSTTEFVREHDLVTVFDDPVSIIEMPEIHRGVAVAYCDPPGPLETASLPTFFAVSPTPAGWPADRVESFYREYNGHLLHNLTVHEAMPGHVLQLAHSRRMIASTRVRDAFWSGPFVEGWAVYAEELMVARGYRGADNLALRMHQLKMQLRMIINTILDVRVHCHDMTEAEGMDLMIRRGHQEEGEAAGKWRRALLTSTQLSTYYVGYLGVREIAADLRILNPQWSDRELHDAMLAHGSPPVRHLRALLGLPSSAF